MTVRIPGGGNGNLLKSWIPWRYVLAEILGLMWVGRIMLRVFSHCGINLHHRCRGNLGLIPTRPDMRWDFPSMDGLFSPVSSVHLRGGKLKFHIIICDEFLDGCGALIIHSAIFRLQSYI